MERLIKSVSFKHVLEYQISIVETKTTKGSVRWCIRSI